MATRRDPQRLIARVAGVALALLLASCAPPAPPRPDSLDLVPVAFDALPGWADDRLEAALDAFRRSCPVLVRRGSAAGGREIPAEAWRGPCAAAEQAQAARAFFETEFRPYAMRNGNGAAEEGLFTGYYEPELHGARASGRAFATPLYKRPPELVTVDLGAFRPDWRGERIAGKVERGRLVPYASRAEIGAGALAGRGLELYWTDDPVAAFFLQVQGSGRLVLGDGTVVRLGFDGQNGHRYVPIGRVLAERGELQRDAVSLQSIRDWLRAHQAAAPALMDENPSFVFFRELSGDGPVGSQGVVLTPERSLAVDERFVPLGAPLFLDAEDPLGAGRLQRLLVAQDTGGAIRGPVRGDVFWGHGEAAEARAGRMRSRGRGWLLLPRGAAVAK